MHPDVFTVVHRNLGIYPFTLNEQIHIQYQRLTVTAGNDHISGNTRSIDGNGVIVGTGDFQLNIVGKFDVENIGRPFSVHPFSDHQIIADAMAIQLGKEAPSIIG